MKCNHIIGFNFGDFSASSLVRWNDKIVFPGRTFRFCPICGEKITMELMSKRSRMSVKYCRHVLVYVK